MTVLEIDGQDPDLALFAGARSYRSRESITAVRLTEPVRIRTLLGVEVGEPGDYLCRDRASGCASIVDRAMFEATYFAERELDGAVRGKPRKKMVIE